METVKSSVRPAKKVDKRINSNPRHSERTIVVDQYEHVPQQMKDRAQWVVWRKENRPNNKTTKVLYQAEDIKNDKFAFFDETFDDQKTRCARSNDSSTWCNFETAEEVASKCSDITGIGYVFSEDDKTAGIDLDHCFDEDGEPTIWARAVVKLFRGTYVERSPSGDGLHIYVASKALKTGSKTLADGGKIEVFNKERFFTVTGKQYSLKGYEREYDGALRRCERGLIKLAFRYWKEGETSEADDRKNEKTSEEELRHYLQFVHPDGEARSGDRSLWLSTGLIIKNENFDLPVWDEWSRASEDYNKNELATAWDSFKDDDRPNKVRIGTLIMNAKKHPDFRPFQHNKSDCLPVLKEEAYLGIAGEFVKEACAQSEADPVGVLTVFLTRAGAEFGDDTYLQIGNTKHPPRLQTYLVGKSSIGRKGTAADTAHVAFRDLDQYDFEGCTAFEDVTLSSGEGLIDAVRDPSDKCDKEGAPLDPGVEEKRLYLCEREFGNCLRQFAREGNNLSCILRQAFDSGDLRPLTKNNKLKATGAHVVLNAHVTLVELKKLLKDNEIFNGLVNRGLWVMVQRRKVVIDPPPLPAKVIQRYTKRLADLMQRSRHGEISFSPEAKELWGRQYARLTADRSDILDTVTARATVIVKRLALIYFLLDETSPKHISIDHLKAALALWDYSEASARIIFESATSTSPIERRILDALKDGTKTRTYISKTLFQGNIPADKLDEAVERLIGAGKIGKIIETKSTGKGRPAELFKLLERK